MCTGLNPEEKQQVKGSAVGVLPKGWQVHQRSDGKYVANNAKWRIPPKESEQEAIDAAVERDASSARLASARKQASAEGLFGRDATKRVMEIMEGGTPPAADQTLQADSPVTPKSAAEVPVAVAGQTDTVNVAPTEREKKAGNYKKAHVKIQGLDISIENPEGSERSGTGPGGKPWKVRMPASYGYLKRTEGADGDQVDVYVGPKPEADTVYVVDQVDADSKKFDEHKAMLGYESEEAALADYDAAFDDKRGPERRADVVAMPVDEFKGWLKSGDTKTPAAAPMKRADGSAFKTEQGARLAARNKKINAEPVQVAGGWALRRAGQAAKAPGKPVDAVKVLSDTRSESFTPAGDTSIETDLAVVDAADLIVSHNEQGKPDPRYPRDLQPRERDRSTSQQQIREMASRIQPGMLGESPTTDTGAPIVGPDGAVESGNGRAAAIRLAYRRKKGDAYRTMVEQQARRAGLDIAGMKAPVLVRVRQGGTEDRAAFARQSNVSAAARMSASERAKSDVQTAGRDVLETYGSDPARAIGRFVEALPATERSAMFDADGRPSKELDDRVRNAVLWQAYESDSILRAAAESQDPDSKQLLNGLIAATRQFVEVNNGTKTALTAAVDRIATARATGMNNKQMLEQMVGQHDLIPDEHFDDGARAIATHLLTRARSGKQIGEYLVELGQRASRAEESQAYGGMDLLGEVPKADVETLAEQADDATAAPVEIQNALLKRQDGPKLRATHSLSVENLRAAMKQGGMPAPSIAITPAEVPHRWGGEAGVDVIFKAGAVKPGRDYVDCGRCVDAYASSGHTAFHGEEAAEKRHGRPIRERHGCSAC